LRRDDSELVANDDPGRAPDRGEDYEGKDDLWLDNARASNSAAQALARAAPDRLVYPVEANEIFLRVNPDEAATLRAEGFDFYDWGPGEIRLVTSWDQDGKAVQQLADAISRL
jgi:threonine aldolase